VALSTEESRGDSDAIADALRRRGVPTEVAASAQKYGRQIRYAERRGIPFVWFPGTDTTSDSVRDIRTGDQRDADVTTWTPPLEDLRPQVTTKEQAL
jgi:histidyl-tRNA synthetase